MNLKNRIVTAAAYIIIFIAVAVIAGWFLGNVYLKSVSQGFVAMNPFTALLFICCGLALLALQSRKKNAVLILASLTCLLGVLRVVGFLADFDPIETFTFRNNLNIA